MTLVYRRPRTKTNRDRTRWRIDRVDAAGNAELVGHVIDSRLERAGKTPRAVRWRAVTPGGISLRPCATLNGAVQLLEADQRQLADMAALGWKRVPA